MRARREVASAVAKRYRPLHRSTKARILDELCATTGWRRKHAVRALRQHEPVTEEDVEAPREASDRVGGKQLKVMIPTLLLALERNDRLKLEKADRDRVLAVSAASIDRLLGAVKLAASGGKRRRAGSSLAIRREVPIRTFNDWKNTTSGFCKVDMVTHGGPSVTGSFIQMPTTVDLATGWTECVPLVRRVARSLLKR